MTTYVKAINEEIYNESLKYDINVRIILCVMRHIPQTAMEVVNLIHENE